MKRSFKKILASVMAMSLATAAFAVYPAMAANEDGDTSTTDNVSTYTGEAQKPGVSNVMLFGVSDDGTTTGVQLHESEDGGKTGDYYLEYTNNTNVGTATVTINFINNYTGTRTVNFEIVANTIGSSDVVYGPYPNPEKPEEDIYTDPDGNPVTDITNKLLISKIDDHTYTGAEITPFHENNDGGTQRYVVKYNNATLNMAPNKEAADADTADSANKYTYDYYVTYDNNKKVSTADKPATATIHLLHNYEGDITVNFKIIPQQISPEDVEKNLKIGEIDGLNGIDGNTVVYNREYKRPTLTITYTTSSGNTETLIPADDEGGTTATIVNDDGSKTEVLADYYLTYEDNFYASNYQGRLARISVHFINNYQLADENLPVVKTFKIIPKQVTKENTSIDDIGAQTYTQATIEPKPAVRDITAPKGAGGNYNDLPSINVEPADRPISTLNPSDPDPAGQDGDKLVGDPAQGTMTMAPTTPAPITD